MKMKLDSLNWSHELPQHQIILTAETGSEAILLARLSDQMTYGKIKGSSRLGTNPIQLIIYLEHGDHVIDGIRQ